jgi:hypothetical protein
MCGAVMRAAMEKRAFPHALASTVGDPTDRRVVPAPRMLLRRALLFPAAVPQAVRHAVLHAGVL